MTQSVNEWINDEAVYRTAPATPGLLKSRKDINVEEEEKMNQLSILDILWLFEEIRCMIEMTHTQY